MPASPFAAPYLAYSQKWCDLAERRRNHFVKLYDSGRWKLYYSEAEFLDELRAAVALLKRWNEIVARIKLSRPAYAAPLREYDRANAA